MTYRYARPIEFKPEYLHERDAYSGPEGEAANNGYRVPHNSNDHLFVDRECDASLLCDTEIEVERSGIDKMSLDKAIEEVMRNHCTSSDHHEEDHLETGAKERALWCKLLSD